MPSAIGYIGSLSLGKEVTFGTKVLVTQKVPLISESLSDEFQLLPDLTLHGRANGRQPDRGHQTLSGDITTQLRYGVANLLLENWFGANVAGTYVPLLTTEGLGLTAVVDKNVSLWEFGGLKVSQLVIAGTTDSVMLTATVTGTVSPDAGSILNTEGAIDLLQNSDDNVLFTDLVLRIGDRTQPLSAANDFCVSSFTLTLQRPMDEIFTNCARTPLEPLESGFRAVTFDFELPRYNTEQFQLWKRAGTRLHASLTFTAEGLGTRTFILPQVQLLTVASPLSGPGLIGIAITAQATEAEDVLTSVAVSAAAADNSLNIAGGAAVAATGTLTLTGVATDGETVTIGPDIYEVDTRPGSLAVGAGHIQVDLAGGVTRQAKGTLTLATNPSNGDTDTIGGKVYTWQTVLTNVDGNIFIGADLAASKVNKVNAVNRTGTPGTGYAAATTTHPTVTIAAFISNDAVITAISGGVGGNAIATTETFTAVGNVFDAATLGTTQAGVSPTAAELVAALVPAITAAQTAGVSAAAGGGTSVVVTSIEAGTDGNSIATTDTLANGSWGAATLAGGSGTQDEFSFAYPGSTAYLTGMALAGNNGIAPIVSMTPTKLILAAAGAGGVTLTDAVAGPSVKVVTRSSDIIMQES